MNKGSKDNQSNQTHRNDRCNLSEPPTHKTSAPGDTAVMGVVSAPMSGQPQAGAANRPLFNLPPLPYAHDALEPVIDAQTMGLHHGKHHAAYVNNVNEAAQVAPQIGAHSVDYVLSHLSDLPEAVRGKVRNNLGAHANHSMFWEIMGRRNDAPTGVLLDALMRDFGSLEKLREEFDAAGLRVFGSGWVFVLVSREGKLTIETRPNQDSPIMDGKCVLFGNDVWEHAYYLKYQNRRADYLKAWWSILNWQKIAERYAAARSGTLLI